MDEAGTRPVNLSRRLRSRFTFFGILVSVAAGLLISLLLAGCSKSPVEAPATTVITGTASRTISASNGWRSDYTFSSGGYNYGKISIVSPDQQNCFIEANGIVQGSGTTAPADGYNTLAQAVLGQSYFVKTDAVPHYGRISVIGLNQKGKYTSITLSFDWVVQTEGCNRILQ